MHAIALLLIVERGCPLGELALVVVSPGTHERAARFGAVQADEFGLLLEMLGQRQARQPPGLAAVGVGVDPLEEGVAAPRKDVVQVQPHAGDLGVVGVIFDQQVHGTGKLIAVSIRVRPVGLVQDPDQGIARGLLSRMRRRQVDHPPGVVGVFGRLLHANLPALEIGLALRRGPAGAFAGLVEFCDDPPELLLQ